MSHGSLYLSLKCLAFALSFLSSLSLFPLFLLSCFCIIPHKLNWFLNSLLRNYQSIAARTESHAADTELQAAWKCPAFLYLLYGSAAGCLDHKVGNCDSQTSSFPLSLAYLGQNYSNIWNWNLLWSCLFTCLLFISSESCNYQLPVWSRNPIEFHHGHLDGIINWFRCGYMPLSKHSSTQGAKHSLLSRLKKTSKSKS